MAIDTKLGARVSLGFGRSIQPPEGWSFDGWVLDDPLALLPKSWLRWNPPGHQRLVLRWNLSPRLLPWEVMDRLVGLLEAPLGELPVSGVAALSPALIRIPLDFVTQAEIISYPYTWPLLRIEYFIPHEWEAGTVHYSPTENYALGEYQMLAFEGNDDAYRKYLAVAQASMQTLSLGQAT